MDTIESLRKFAAAYDQFGDDMTIVPRSLLSAAADELQTYRTMVIQDQLRRGNEAARAEAKRWGIKLHPRIAALKS